MGGEQSNIKLAAADGGVCNPLFFLADTVNLLVHLFISRMRHAMLFYNFQKNACRVIYTLYSFVSSKPDLGKTRHMASTVGQLSQLSEFQYRARHAVISVTYGKPSRTCCYDSPTLNCSSSRLDPSKQCSAACHNTELWFNATPCRVRNVGHL